MNFAKKILSSRRQSYRMVFAKDKREVQHVLQDLQRFCRASDSCFHPDPRLHAQLEGRREVWLRIQEFLNLSEEDLWETKRRKDLENV